jgi:REP element-mobilizing transposase RayT
MPQSLAQIYVHFVFSTKERRPFLKDKDLRERLHAYLAGTCNGLDSPCLIVGGVEDHVHVLCRLSRTHSVSETVKELKRESSLWIKRQGRHMDTFHWQDGYGAFSVSPSHLAALTRYIRDQEQHHRKESFQDEFRRLLKKYGVAFDERYVWD